MDAELMPDLFSRFAPILSSRNASALCASSRFRSRKSQDGASEDQDPVFVSEPRYVHHYVQHRVRRHREEIHNTTYV